MRKKLLLFMLSVSTTFTAWSQEEYTTLVVEMNDGTSVNYMLSQKPKISLKQNDVVIDFNMNNDYGLSATYGQSDVKTFYFKEFDPVSIKDNELLQNDLRVTHLDGQTVRISGTEKNDHVAIYTLDGRIMQSNITFADNETVINIAALEKGIYIIKVSDKQTFKVLKR